MAQRPGVMLYFDVRPSLKRLSREEKGQLFEGILDYAEHGVYPEFEGMLGIAWDFIQPRIDRDAEAYEQSLLQKQYAVYCRKRKQEHLPPVDFDAWKVQTADDGNVRALSGDNGPYPSTSSYAKTSSSPPSSTPSAEKIKRREWKGDTDEISFEEKRQSAIAKLGKSHG